MRPIRATASRLVSASAETHMVINAVCNINRNAEHLEEACDTAAEYLKRRASCRRTVSCCSSTGNAQCQNSQQAFQHHSAVANLGHILFIRNGLGGRTRGYQAVETGNRTACNGYKQDREQIVPSCRIV